MRDSKMDQSDKVRRELTRTRTFLQSQGESLPPRLELQYRQINRFAVKITQADLKALEEVLGIEGRAFLTVKNGSLNIIPGSRYDELRQANVKAVEVRKQITPAKTPSFPGGSIEQSKTLGIVLVKSLRNFGAFYSRSLIQLAKEKKAIGVYSSAFSSEAAKNSAAQVMRESGFYTSYLQKGRARILLISVTAPASKAKYKSPPRSGVKPGLSKTWRKDQEGAVNWLRNKGHQTVEDFKKEWMDPNKSAVDLGHKYGCSVSRVSAIGMGLGLTSRIKFRSKFSKVQRDIREQAPVEGQAGHNGRVESLVG